MTQKEKAKNKFISFWNAISKNGRPHHMREHSKECAKAAVEDEYNPLREQLFNLRACGVIQSDKTYLDRINILIEEEKELLNEINNL